MTFRDLAKYGLLLTQLEDGGGAWLSNESGNAVVVLALIWSFNGRDGINFGSSMQMDVLAGRATVGQDRYNFILPGSRR